MKVEGSVDTDELVEGQIVAFYKGTGGLWRQLPWRERERVVDDVCC